MTSDATSASLAALPSIDVLLRRSDAEELIAEFGRNTVTEAIRAEVAKLRAEFGAGKTAEHTGEHSIVERAARRLKRESRSTLQPVFNLTGTVLHTNLGRASLPDQAIEAAARAAHGPSNLEYDLANGHRGDRDAHVEEQLRRLTGAEAATVVNNNAAAVLLVLNSLAARKEVPVSRGELIEIGGSFRIPDIMTSSGCRLREVGATNRTHLSDFDAAIGPKTGLVMKVHTSNYSIEGFTASVSEADLAGLCHSRGVPFAVDLGSGTLIDLRNFGLPHEPTASEAIAHGADVVTFSGDKLLGGPQAGIIVGRTDLIKKIKRNPLKRALRVDKMTVAALSAVLQLYSHPERLAERLPTLRLLTRPAASIRASAERMSASIAPALANMATVEVIDCDSQIGSGALPSQRIPSAGIAIRPLAAKRKSGTALKRIADAFRGLPIPVIGRLEGGSLILDLRCLEDEDAFLGQLPALMTSEVT